MSNKQSRRKAKVTFLVLLTLAIAISTLISSYYLKNRTSYSSQAAGQGMIINSFEAIPDIAKQRKYDEIFYIKIPKNIYRPWFIAAVHQYLLYTGNQMIGEPIDVDFRGLNKISGTFSYQLPSETARKIVEYQHYYYIDSQKAIKVRVTSANVSEGGTIPNLKNIIENTVNSVLDQAWTVYRQYVEPTFISNDANYLYLGLRVKTGTPLTPPIPTNTLRPPPIGNGIIGVFPEKLSAPLLSFCEYKVNWNVPSAITSPKITFKHSGETTETTWCTNCFSWGKYIGAKTLSGKSTEYRLYDGTTSRLLAGPVTFQCFELIPTNTLRPPPR